MKLKLIGMAASMLASSTVFAVPSMCSNPVSEKLSINDVQAQARYEQLMLANIATSNHLTVQGEVFNTLPGMIVAAQSNYNPDYAYHWARDAGLTMLAVNDLAKQNFSKYQSYLDNYINWSSHINTLSPVNYSCENEACPVLGEPKFNLDGSIYTGPWGRNQNDGPAIRAVALMQILDNYAKNNKTPKGYDNIDAVFREVIEPNLNYVASNWQSPTFDLWEEVKGMHFFTLMTQYTSLILADQFAKAHNISIHQNYDQIAQEIKKYLEDHFYYTGSGYTYHYARVNTLTALDIPTKANWNYFDQNKHAWMNISIILAIAFEQKYLSKKDLIWSLSSDATLNTAYETINYYADKNVNSPTNLAAYGGPNIGRYPADVYGGTAGDQAGAWFLATTVMSRVYLQVASEINQGALTSINSINVKFFNQAITLYRAITGDSSMQMLKAGDSVNKKLASVMMSLADNMLYANQRHGKQPCGFGNFSACNLSEQYNFSTGVEQSVSDLTWSYAEVLRALQQRNKICS
ncbi:glycoside hydrolase family 15 protein [Fangia hongkongensis]|uniref:glycoside hydrolase family 15 protein n=1 Tax=Fangia hongkongensis TaxID=270495 RepID=UPI00036058F3|nr:glycoside hydrolase family 15 protein [Fangia hongkongensis]MBK2125916.1 hypothetical protein [Fangia hongkongensis]